MSQRGYDPALDGSYENYYTNVNPMMGQSLGLAPIRPRLGIPYGGRSNYRSQLPIKRSPPPDSVNLPQQRFRPDIKFGVAQPNIARMGNRQDLQRIGDLFGRLGGNQQRPIYESGPAELRNQVGDFFNNQNLSSRSPSPVATPAVEPDFTVGFRNLRVGFHNRHAIDSRSHNLRADFQDLPVDLPVDFRNLLQCRFLLPEERVKGIGLSPEVTILSRLALRIIREKDSPVRVGKAIDLVIISQERLLVTDKFKICRIGLEAQGFLKIFTDFKILIILLINLLRTPLILMTPAVNPEAHQTMVE